MSDYDNGQGILYRPADANKRPRSHQWNITVDRELARNVSLSVAYVGSRRPSPAVEHRSDQRAQPEPSVDGQALYDQFAPGVASVDGVAARTLTGRRNSS